MNDIFPQASYRAVKSVLGPRQAGRVVKDIQKWISSSGPSWTVNRLKSIFSACKQLRAGNSDLAKTIYQENSIQYDKKSLLPKGSLYPAASMFVHGQRPIVIRRGALVLRAYSSIVLDELPEEKLQSSKESITTPSTTAQTEFINVFKSHIDDWVRENRNLFPNEVGNPNIGNLKAFTNCYAPEKSGSSYPFKGAISSLVTATYLPHDLRYPETDAERLREVLDLTALDTESAGRLCFLLEGGAKVRTIAVPNAWIQWQFEPLHQFLDQAVRNHNQSVVHDQNQGAWFMQHHVSNHNKLWCFDLSSATERFPFAWQKQVLESLGLDRYAEAFEDIRYCWMVDETVNGKSYHEQWDFAKGQPMGVYGSFPLFHITHAAMLEILCKVADCSPDSYRVLGDDIIISDHRLAIAYASTMKKAGVPISKSKSIYSDNMAEFGGFLSVKTTKSVTTFRPYKHSCGDHHRNVMNLIYSIGPSLAKNLGVRYKQASELYFHTVSDRNPDLSPIVGQSPEGGIVRAPFLTTNRLASLITSEYNEVIPEFVRMQVPSSDLDPKMMRDGCSVLIDHQNRNGIGSSILSDEILGTQNEKPESPDKFSYQEKLENDPLYRKAKKIDEKSNTSSTLDETNVFSD